MNMSEWAKREVEIACKRERERSKNEEEWNYGVACYESALKAFNSLMEDEHSGYSIGITKYILNRLIEGKALTPIKDTPDIWEETFALNDVDYKCYQCNRMTSLFKYVYNDGTITFKDVGRVVCYYKDDPNCCGGWHNGLADRIVDECCPITMPYIPAYEHFKLYCSEGLTDRKNGDFDTCGFHYVITPSGDKVTIDRYFKEGPSDWIEIDANEFNERMRISEEITDTVKGEKLNGLACRRIL